MGSASRAKGLTGEREVRAIWRAAGLDVRGLEGQGDHIVMRLKVYRGDFAAPTPERESLTLHSEVKRTETARPWAWMEQAEREAPTGAVPVVSFRRSRSKWYAIIGLDDLARLLS